MLKRRFCHFWCLITVFAVACCMLTGCLADTGDTANSTTTSTSTTATTTTTSTTTSSNDENEDANAEYASFLKEWKYVKHYWQGANEYFYISHWNIQMTENGLVGYFSETPYAAIEDVGEDFAESIAFEYNGKHFARFGGGGYDVILEKESDTVWVGYNVDNENETFRFVLDPEKETLTVTQTDADDMLVTQVFDTKMSVEDGIFVELDAAEKN